jgi:pimeloyl-ACP methyl ester carboxylesterase
MKTTLRITLFFSVIFTALALVAFVLPVEPTDAVAEATLVDEDGQFIELQGISIYVRDEGDGETGTMLMLHGLFGSTEVWRYNVEGLIEAGYRVIRFDRPAFGLSYKGEDFDYSVGNQADLTAELMVALGVEQAVIIGHSAGGNVATHFAVRHPERVEQLVLVDAASLAGGPPGFVGSIVALPSVWRWARFVLQNVFTREQLANSLRGFYVDDSFWTDEDTDAYWRAFQTVGWDVGLLALTRDGGGNLLGEDAIRSIEADTVIIWGSEDTVTPLEQGERLAELIPKSTLQIIENTGHQPFEEAPEAFNNVLIEYLTDNS